MHLKFLNTHFKSYKYALKKHKIYKIIFDYYNYLFIVKLQNQNQVMKKK